MKKTKRFLLPAAAALLALALLAGCSAGSASDMPADAYNNTPALEEPTTGGGGIWPAPEADEYGEVESYTVDRDTMTSADGGTADTPSLTIPQDDRKVILNASLTIESLEFGETCAAIQAAAGEAGGYVSGTNLNASETDIGYRTADFVIKVPAEAYADFMSAMGGVGNVTSRSESSEDITAAYVDIESRLSSLRAQETRLLELMGQAADLADLLAVQEQLTEVQYEIESYEATRKTYDNLVAYSTVSIYVYEVREITETPSETWADRVGAAFRESWKNFGRFWQEFSIGFVWFLPAFIIIVIILVVVLILVRRAMKKRKNAPPPYQGWPQQTSPYAARPVAPAVQTPPAEDPPGDETPEDTETPESPENKE